MKRLSVLIKPASSLCNLRCKYCFYADVSAKRSVRSYGRMQTATTDTMVAQLFADLEDGAELTMAFQGGEPTLAGLPYFKHLVAQVAAQPQKVQVHYSIQTNGTLLDDQWAAFLRDQHFMVGLSIDGPTAYHDRNRVDTHGRGTYQRVWQAKQLLDDYQIEYNILCVLTAQLARHPRAVYAWLQKSDIAYVQFIPCLDALEPTETSAYALTPQGFYAFYRELFALWLADLQHGRYRSIKLFDDVYNLLVRHEVTACGLLGQCSVQFVIEADGSVYPCDFYVLDQYRLGNLKTHTLRELFHQPQAQGWLRRPIKRPAMCAACPMQRVCRGGCPRMSAAMYVDETQHFCGYQQLLELMIPAMGEIQAIVNEAMVH